MATPNGTATAARQAASGYALRVLPHSERLTPLPGTSTFSGGSAAPPQVKPGRGDFRCGEKVSFEDKYLQTQAGIVLRINQRTATVDTSDGQSWRVGFTLLRHVLDI